MQLGSAPTDHLVVHPEAVLADLLADHERGRLPRVGLVVVHAVLLPAVELAEHSSPAEVGVPDEALVVVDLDLQVLRCETEPDEDDPAERLTRVVRPAIGKVDRLGHQSGTRPGAAAREHLTELLARDAHPQRRVESGDCHLEAVGGPGDVDGRTGLRCQRKSVQRAGDLAARQLGHVVVDAGLDVRPDRVLARDVDDGQVRVEHGQLERHAGRLVGDDGAAGQGQCNGRDVEQVAFVRGSRQVVLPPGVHATAHGDQRLRRPGAHPLQLLEAAAVRGRLGCGEDPALGLHQGDESGRQVGRSAHPSNGDRSTRPAHRAVHRLVVARPPPVCA
jgi:hypothetical protein